MENYERITVDELIDELKKISSKGKGHYLISANEYYITKNCNSNDNRDSYIWPLEVILGTIHVGNIKNTPEQDMDCDRMNNEIMEKNPDLKKSLNNIFK